ncbi:hypothetical protein MC885_017204 [Smutsia gigantea]|nr:hypothetical protein MC885_017204 [Smutsia gigantea]
MEADLDKDELIQPQLGELSGEKLLTTDLEDHRISPQMAQNARNTCLPALPSAHLPVYKEGELDGSEPCVSSSCKDIGSMRRVDLGLMRPRI